MPTEIAGILRRLDAEVQHLRAELADLEKSFSSLQDVRRSGPGRAVPSTEYLRAYT